MVKIKRKKQIRSSKKNKSSYNKKKFKNEKLNNKNKNKHNYKNKNSYRKCKIFRKKRIISKRSKNSLSKKNIKIKKTKKVKARKSLNLISPFNIDKNIEFFYDLEKFEDFPVFTNDINKYKLSENELLFLHKLVNDIEKKKNNESEDSSIKILPEFYDNFKSLKIKPKLSNQRVNIIKLILEENKFAGNLSLRKIKDEFNHKTGKNISIGTISNILRYTLEFRYLKTTPKPKLLSTVDFKRKSYFLIRIIYEILKNGLEFIYIDETKIQLKNSNLRIWRNKHDSFNYTSIKQDKINLILAVTKFNVVHYEFNKKNTNTNIFKNFFIEMLNKIGKEHLSKYVFFFDNARFHKSRSLLSFYKNNNLKMISNVPYESAFDSVELSFRYIKNILYKKIYTNINEIISDVNSILNSKKFINSLLFQYKETLEKYLLYHNKFINEDLNSNN